MRNSVPIAFIALCSMLAVYAAPARAAQDSSRTGEQPALWLYSPTNLLPNENIDKLEALWRRAAAAGYTKVLLTDSKFSRLSYMDKRYFQNCERVKKLADELKLEIVPAEFSIGYSDDLLSNDPNLAEGVPVKDTPFVVKDGQARCAGDPSVALNKLSYKDDCVTLDGSTATVHPHTGNARLVFDVPVQKFRCYHVSVRIKADNYTGHPEIHPLAGDRTLNWQNIHVERTQDWKQYDVVFDSLDNEKVLLFFGVWGPATGTLQWSDWKIAEAGLVNVLRRSGAPCVVKTEDGKTLVEGTDYEPISDPKMGRVPYEGEYEVWHEAPPIRTKLPDGTRLRVSWYYPPLVYDGQVAACISDPKTTELLVDQNRRMKQLWGAKGYMMSYDEFRVFNWDESCEERHETPGKMLADSVRQCTKLVSPQQAYTWNDMFDPFHNARDDKNYFLVNGSWAGSWEGLDKNVIIFNWNDGHRDESLKFFADRGHRQIIAGYYDNPMSDWQKWLDSAAKVKGVIGYMYTTWQNDYSHLEEFAKMSRR